jgi:hypothetical protein
VQDSLCSGSEQAKTGAAIGRALGAGVDHMPTAKVGQRVWPSLSVLVLADEDLVLADEDLRPLHRGASILVADALEPDLCRSIRNSHVFRCDEDCGSREAFVGARSGTH